MKKITLPLTLILLISLSLQAQTVDVFPYLESFEDSTDPLTSNFPNGWTVESNGTSSAANLSWVVTNNPAGQAQEGDWFALVPGIPSVSLDEWLFTPPLQLESGINYRITFYYRTGANGGQPMTLHVGTAATAASMSVDPIWEDLVIDNVVYEQGEVLYTAIDDNPVFFGFNITSNGGVISQNLLDTVSFDIETLTIDDFDAADFKFFPNPANDFFTLELPSNVSDMFLQIYDIQGKLVLEEKSVLQNSNVAIDKLSNGIYIVKLFNENIEISKKLIIQN